MTDVMILLPAAGAGHRMRGADKLLELVDGQPLLGRQARRARATGCRVIVTLPAGNGPAARARAAVLDGLGVDCLRVADAAEGMAASLRAGARAALAAGAAGLMVLPADMPDLETTDLARLCDAFAGHASGTILQATAADGRPGHPVILPSGMLPELARLSGDVGARALLVAHRDRLRHHALSGNRALTDLDTPEAWAAWRAARQTGGQSPQ